MKILQIVLILVVTSTSLVLGKVGTLTCVKKTGIHPDKTMEQTMGVKCPLDLEAMNNLDPKAEMTVESMNKMMGVALGAHLKCMYDIIKAVDAKGKIIPKAAEKMDNSYAPADFKKCMKEKMAACVKKHNPELKKETGKSGKSWAGFAVCKMDAMDKCCPA